MIIFWSAILWLPLIAVYQLEEDAFMAEKNISKRVSSRCLPHLLLEQSQKRNKLIALQVRILLEGCLPRGPYRRCRGD